MYIAGDLARLSEIHTNYGDYSSFKRQPSAQSTPYPNTAPVFDRLTGGSIYAQTSLMATPCSMQSQLSTGMLSATDGNLVKHLPDRTPGILIDISDS